MPYLQPYAGPTTIVGSIKQYQEKQIDFQTFSNKIDEYITSTKTNNPIDELLSYQWMNNPKIGTAVTLCVDYKLIDVLELLLTKYNANPRYISSSDGMTPLVMACINGDQEIVELLINSCKRVSSKFEFKNFINQTNFDIAEFRENGGGVLNNYTLKTPLMYAAHYGHLEIVKLLLKNGADSRIKDRKFGFTALDYANGVEVEKAIAKKYSWATFLKIKYEESQQFFQDFVSNFHGVKIHPETAGSSAVLPLIKTSSLLIETDRSHKILGKIEEEGSDLDF